ncbi:MAG: MCE family protein [Proteobacteria bacterium]|nr:MCE family protein [Pseudomonadota bacterium]
MATIRTKLMVGIFVLIGFTLATVSIIWLGMSSYFEKGLHYVAYFDESVQGLDRDSPVKYRGVPIGRVESIKVAPDSTLIEVVMKIEEGLKPEEHREDVVAQLKSVGITGIMFVEIENKKENDPDLSPRINFSPKYPVVATKPSDIKKLIQGIDDIVNQFKSLDFISISDKLKSILDTMNQGVADLQLKRLSSDISTSLKKVENIMDSVETTSSAIHALAVSADRTVSHFDRVIDRNKNEVSEIISNFSRLTKRADHLLANGEILIKATDNRLGSLQHQLNASLNNLEIATTELTRLIEQISDQPSQLILGSPPPARQVEPE